VNNFTKHHPSKPALIIALSVGVAIIGIATFVTLTRDTARQSNTSSSTPAMSSTGLTTRALEKLSAGNQKEGLDDLQAALTIAKRANDSKAIKYIEQQIDFARTSNFSPQGTPPAPASPSYPTKF